MNEDEQNLARLNRYLAILEKQQKGRQFCSGRSPHGVWTWEFVRQRLHDRNLQSSPSAARMAFLRAEACKGPHAIKK